MRTDDLSFELPRELIAVRPATPRDSARLLVVDARGGVSHHFVRDLPDLLTLHDVLVANATTVLPARFVGAMADSAGAVEGLWLRDDQPATEAAGNSGPSDHAAHTGTRWIALVRARRFRPGRRIVLHLPSGDPAGVELELIEKLDERHADQAGAWRLQVHIAPESGLPPDAPTPRILEAVGRTPIPPYIRSARRDSGINPSDAFDREAYQTVFAGPTPTPDLPPVAGSVAAPTAGLHFTPALLERLDAAGVRRELVTLQVGAGTFKPVEAERLQDHRMHAEWCSLEPAGARILKAVDPGTPGPAAPSPAACSSLPTGRLVAVGTTSVRTLEAFAAWIDANPADVCPRWLSTDLLITPGYRWLAVQGLLTNFHLPRSTLLALVAAITPGGLPRLLEIYAEAIALGYRFFSYGDAMLVLPEPRAIPAP